ncbi:MAG: hypothetical protein GKS06_03945 [Acidobacteria bacterium]|nr:hypothetical protein [Acidobacteriota bacterium]
MKRNQPTEAQRLRKFGIVMAVFFGLFGALFVCRERAWGEYVLYVAAFFLVSGLVLPKLLAPIEKAWMALAGVLQVVMTTLILTLTFFLVMTPMGLFLRLTGKDLLGMEGDPSMDTYWVPVERDGPASRPDKPY